MFAENEQTTVKPQTKPLQEIPAPDAGELHAIFYRSSRHYKEFCAMASSVRLGLFEALGEPLTVDQLALACGLKAGPLQPLCGVLVGLGLLERRGAVYVNTALSALYLTQGSPWFQGAVMDDIQFGFALWDRLDQVLLEGPVAVEEEAFFENGLVDSLAAEILCGELQRTVAAVVGVPSFKKARTLLDLGGGHGLYAIALCQQNPHLDATVFDFPDMAAKAGAAIEGYGASRVRFVPGNLFAEDFGSGHDVVLLSYNPGGKNPALFGRIADALAPGGLFVTKHVYYRDGEGSKDHLMDLEWSLSAFNGVTKGPRIYDFSGDLTWDAYLSLMEERFEIVDVIESEIFAGHPLAKFGDRLDSRMILAVKRDV